MKKGGRNGRGRPNSLGPCIGFPSGRGRAPLSFRKRATRPRATGRVIAPWANSGASRATLPDFKSTCQMPHVSITFTCGDIEKANAVPDLEVSRKIATSSYYDITYDEYF
jgi:hypothetical protein